MGTTDNPNAANNNGLTPINVAAKGWHFEIVKTLMSTTDDSKCSRHVYCF